MKQHFDAPPGNEPKPRERREIKDGEKNWEVLKPLLEKTSSIESESQHEEAMREYLLAEAKTMSIETKVDAKGNLWLLSDAPEGEIMLCAHMDKVGKPNKATEKDGLVTGRLDDALGLSLILGALKKGARPSVLFTVEEEIGFHGAEEAVDQIANGDQKCPAFVLVLDVSGLRKHGHGPLVYTSAGGRDFPKEPLQKLDILIKANSQRAELLPGFINDSVVFTSIGNLAIATLQVHVDHIHTKNEVAALDDIKEAAAVLDTILTNYSKLIE